MKNIFIKSAALLAAVTGVLAVSVPNASAQEMNDNIAVVSEEVTLTNTNYFRTVPDSLLAQDSFEYGGIKYTTSTSGVLTANLPDNPSTVKELILYYQFGKAAVKYPETIDWSQYTSLEDVLVVGTNVSFAQAILPLLPSGTNLYLGCSCNLAESLTTMPFKNVYLYYLYDPSTNSFTDSDFYSYLENSSIENIYYNDFIGTVLVEDVTRFNEVNPVNKNGASLNMKPYNDWKYPAEVFYPFYRYEANSPVFESTGYWKYNTDKAASSMSNFVFEITSVDDRVINLDCTGLSSLMSIPKSKQFGIVNASKNKDYYFGTIKADELIIKTYSNAPMGLNLEYLKYIKTLRFVDSYNTLNIITNSSLPEDSLLEKIYIPEVNKNNFSAITEHETLSKYIEYYDQDSWEAPTNSYLSDDGNVYNVRSNSYTIEEVDFSVQLLKSMGLEVPSGTVVDDMMGEYEISIKDVSTLVPTYSSKVFDTIVLPKGMNVQNVLNAFAQVATLNHGYITDEAAQITFKAEDYTLNEDLVLPITITFKDGTTHTQNVNVKVIDDTLEVAYVLDGDNVYLISNITSKDESLAYLMSPLMDKYLKESMVEYDESPILDTTKVGYIAANSYSTAVVNGDVKVLITDIDLVENQDTETPEDDSVYEVKAIDKIYTTEEIDGTKLLMQMRKFICLKDGEVYDDISFIIGTNSGRTNKEAYTFSAIANLSNNYKYNETLSVDIIELDYKMGFVMFENGDIAVLFNLQDKYDKETIEQGLKQFLELQSLNADTVSIPDGSYSDTKTYEGSYDEGKIYIVNSGSNLYFTSATQPTDQTVLKQGYVGLNKVMYTKDFTMEDAIRALGKNVLLKDGVLVNDFDISYTTTEGSNVVEVVFKDGDTELLKENFYFEQVESEYSYIFARADNFDYGYLILDKQSKAPEYTLNDVMVDVISRFRTLMAPFSTSINVDFTQEMTKDVDGIYVSGNGAYYTYEYNVEVLDVKEAIKKNDVVVDGVGAKVNSITDKLNGFIDDFKTKFEENKTFKIMTIALGSITGILLLWGAWAILKKILRWFKK